MRVLVTSARAPHALAIIRSFGDKGWEVTAGDCTRLSPGLYSRFVNRRLVYPSVTEKPAEFIRTLLAELHLRHYDLLFPAFEDLFLIARVRDKLPPNLPHLVPPYDQLMLVHNKASLARFCEQHGISSPHTIQPKNEAELEQAASETAYPVIIKLAETNNSTGLTIAKDVETLRSRYLKLVKFYSLTGEQWPLLQAKIDGEMIYSLFMADQGRVVGQLVYRPLMMFPDGGGTAFYREAIRHAPVEEVSRKCIAALGWHGFIGLDYIVDRGTGTAYLIDVNPRPSPAYNLGLAAGVDFTQQFIDLAQKKSPRPNLEPREGVRSKILFVEILWFLFQLLPGKGYFQRARKAFTVFRKRNFIPDIHRRDDKKPSLVMALFVYYFMFIINTIKPSRGGYMFGCNYDRALADRMLKEAE